YRIRLSINITILPSLIEICHLPPQRGNCSFSVEAWYYNPDTAKCETFMCSYCGGNLNRFTTKKRCKDNC
ncbi:hypothetical protein KR038_010111, partial [Drosophila bunnanda]